MAVGSAAAAASVKEGEESEPSFGENGRPPSVHGAVTLRPAALPGPRGPPRGAPRRLRAPQRALPRRAGQVGRGAADG